MGNPLISVLLVDDEEAAVLVPMARALRHYGCDVHTASDGVRGLELAHTVQPMIAIIDQIMPGMRGVEMVRALKRISPHTVTVVHSGLLTDELRAEAAEAGADACVDKPTSPRELLAFAKAHLLAQD